MDCLGTKAHLLHMAMQLTSQDHPIRTLRGDRRSNDPGRGSSAAVVESLESPERELEEL